MFITEYLGPHGSILFHEEDTNRTVGSWNSTTSKLCYHSLSGEKLFVRKYGPLSLPAMKRELIELVRIERDREAARFTEQEVADLHAAEALSILRTLIEQLSTPVS